MLDKGSWTRFFRNAGLMHTVDRIKYQYLRLKNRSANQSFAAKHPGVVFPPDYMMFEAFNLDYQRYLEGGKKSAEWLVAAMARHTSLRDKEILDWGCGPARIIRHLPTLIKTDCRFYGTDYNSKTIDWCKANIKEIEFAQNELHPPTNYPAERFDIIYGISIFTHLSAINHQHWFNELIRILRPGGLLLLTTQGRAFKERLDKEEKILFDKNQLVIRGKVIEGHRVFSAFHPPTFMENLFQSSTNILELVEGKKMDWGIEQDLWILKKKLPTEDNLQ